MTRLPFGPWECGGLQQGCGLAVRGAGRKRFRPISTADPKGRPFPPNFLNRTSERSDLDFLVDFLPPEEGQLAPDYFGLLHDLEDLFHRKIEVMVHAIRNPYFLRGVNQSRRVIYAA